MIKHVPNHAEITKLIKNHWGHVVALLINTIKDIELCEDAVQDAVESALHHWHKNGIPTNPQAWLFTTAKHKALDQIRRAKNFKLKQKHYLELIELDVNDQQREDDYTIPDERLRLIFTCCHPAIDAKISIALALKLIVGLSTEEIADAFLLKTETMAQRLFRGKRQITRTSISYTIPEQKDFPCRLNAVLTVLYLIFNEGYFTTSGEVAIRQDLSREAIRITKIFMQLCSDPEIKGLLALMLIHESRRKARLNHKNEFVPLEFHNRKLWDIKQQQKGNELIQSALKQKSIGRFQLQAVISAMHSQAKDYASTNWKEIIVVYQKLLKIDASPIIYLNQLVALSNLQPVATITKQLNALQPKLKNYYPFYVVKADFLEKLGEYKDATLNYTQAIELCKNKHHKQYLGKRLKYTLKLR
ncbi:MAG: hypothetical protein L3J53_03700 [Proteobacteria bacterium]|nr:hypothetical protein [Pseudomonadota bacterium]